MKVNSVSAMTPYCCVSNFNNNKNKGMTAPISRELMEYPKGYVPHQINFAGGLYAKLPEIKLLKTLKNLPCLYCAQKMVQASVIESLGVNGSIVERTVSEVAELISKKPERTQGVGKKLMGIIEKTAKNDPLKSSVELLKELEEKNIDIPDFVKRYSTRPMSGLEYAQKAINTASEYENGLMPTEKEVFHMIKEEYNKNPKQTISQILEKLRGSKLDKFEISQTKILDEIEEMAEATLSKQTRDKVLFETQRSKNLLNKNNVEFPFKRKKFIEVLERIHCPKNDIEAMFKILQKADSIPTSKNDVMAFIAKYSNKNILSDNGSYVSRSDSEIMQRLLSPSIMSVEHIRPQVTFKTSKGNYTGPKDVIQNLALAHRQCNCDRGHLTLEEYMKINPKARESIQKHVDFIIKEIKAGRLRGLEKYPQQLQETFSKETDGRLVIDISEINEYLEKFLANKKH